MGSLDIIGFQTDKKRRLFYSFDLEDHVPHNHLLRVINHYLDLTELRQHLAEYFSNTGRPSIDPELMTRMLVIGYRFGIRSERILCEEVHLNLAYRSFKRDAPKAARPLIWLRTLNFGIWTSIETTICPLADTSKVIRLD